MASNVGLIIFLRVYTFVIALLFGIYSPSLLSVGRPSRAYLLHWKIRRGWYILTKRRKPPETYYPYTYDAEKLSSFFKPFLFVILVIFLLTIGGSVSAGEVELVPDGVSYLPLVYSEPCKVNKKVSVALAYWERGIPHDILCVPSTNVYHNWRWIYREDEWGILLPTVWTDTTLQLFITFKEQWEVINEQEAKWILLWANEPDRDDQADLTPLQVAELFLAIVEACPKCRLVGPMYSAADSGWLVAQVWRLVEEICGSPCPAVVNNRYAHSLHIYPRPDANGGPAFRVLEFCRIVEGQDDCDIPIWITEMGYRSCYPYPYLIFKDWVTEALNHTNIEQIFLYSTFQSPQTTCQFMGALQWYPWQVDETYSIDVIGRAWRDGIMAAETTDTTIQAYP
jgi:hypothetical protein